MKVEVLDKKLVYDGVYKMVHAKLKYELPNGEMTDVINRLCFERGDGVAGIVYNTDTQKAILVKQFRYPCYEKDGGWLVEVVAGTRDDDDTASVMKREVLEEIGYEVSHMEFISSFYVSPGGSSEKIYLYYIEVNNAGKIQQGGGLEHETEFIEIVEYTIDELRQSIQDNTLQDAKSLLACNYLLNKFPNK